ncbi:hypothetical protein CSC41_2788 [Pseudomonas aeruginosa]|nr:hypothetical protein CSC41_2788 [Pseudomonas aeruginosa]
MRVFGKYRSGLSKECKILIVNWHGMSAKPSIAQARQRAQ